MSFTSITQRFVVWFLLVSLLPILLIGYSLLHTFETELQQTVIPANLGHRRQESGPDRCLSE